jgi:hypothetical protein
MDKTGVFGSFGKPTGHPLFVEAEPESVWMCFLSHRLSPFFV